MDTEAFSKNVTVIEGVISHIDVSSLSGQDKVILEKAKKDIASLTNLTSKNTWDTKDKVTLRQGVLGVQESYKLLSSLEIASLIPSAHAGGDSSADIASISKNVKDLSVATDYIPWWIIVLVSVAI